MHAPGGCLFLGCLLPGGLLPGGLLPGAGWLLLGGGVPCDISHHAFDVTCMLPPHQLRHINSAPAYILLPGHVTCKACYHPQFRDRRHDLFSRKSDKENSKLCMK